MCAAFRLPVVMPELPSVPRVKSPDVVGSSGIKDAIHHENGALFGDSARRVLFESFSSDDRARARGGIEPTDPSESETLDGIAVRLLQSAIPSSRVIAGVRWPGIRKWFEQRCRIDSTL